MTKLVKWGSNDGQIVKSWLSGRRKANFFPSVVDLSYDWLRIEGHLGNVGSNSWKASSAAYTNPELSPGTGKVLRFDGTLRRPRGYGEEKVQTTNADGTIDRKSIVKGVTSIKSRKRVEISTKNKNLWGEIFI